MNLAWLGQSVLLELLAGSIQIQLGCIQSVDWTIGGSPYLPSIRNVIHKHKPEHSLRTLPTSERPQCGKESPGPVYMLLV